MSTEVNAHQEGELIGLVELLDGSELDARTATRRVLMAAMDGRVTLLVPVGGELGDEVSGDVDQGWQIAYPNVLAEGFARLDASSISTLLRGHVAILSRFAPASGSLDFDLRNPIEVRVRDTFLTAKEFKRAVATASNALATSARGTSSTEQPKYRLETAQAIIWVLAGSPRDPPAPTEDCPEVRSLEAARLALKGQLTRNGRSAVWVAEKAESTTNYRPASLSNASIRNYLKWGREAPQVELDPNGSAFEVWHIHEGRHAFDRLLVVPEKKFNASVRAVEKKAQTDQERLDAKKRREKAAGPKG